MTDRRFDRTRRLIGDEQMERLAASSAIVFGIGGVGGWTAECLARTGIGRLTIVDPDDVAQTNINRQVMALGSTTGCPKTDILAERLLDINPGLDLRLMRRRYTAEHAADFDIAGHDITIDAIDSLADKAALILHATSTPSTRLLSSMGAALKADPTKVSVAEFWQVKGCPLAAALRRRFKRDGMTPRRKFRCVYSPELLTNAGDEPDPDGTMTYGKRAINGALCHITAIFGFTLAGLAIDTLLKRQPARDSK
nr:ThiF family adenylyltransferase [Paramuribaculum intestinale]